MTIFPRKRPVSKERKLFSRFPDIEPLGTFLEEIILQRLADPEEQRHGEPLGTAGLGYVLWRAVRLLGQPDRCAALSLQFSFDQLAKVQLRGRYGFVFLHINSSIILQKNNNPLYVKHSKTKMFYQKY